MFRLCERSEAISVQLDRNPAAILHELFYKISRIRHRERSEAISIRHA